MPSSAVYEAVKGRLDANPISGWGFYEPNDARGTTPKDASPFIAYEFPASTSEQITIGSPGQNTWRETGSLRFVVAMPRGVFTDPATGLGTLGGIGPGLAVAEALRALFRNLQDGALRFWELSPPVTDDANADGSYFRLTIAGAYWFDFLA